MMATSMKIRLLRTAQNLRQSDLAEHTGIAVRDISALKSGLTLRWEQRLLEALGYVPEMDAMLNQLAGNGELAAVAGRRGGADRHADHCADRDAISERGDHPPVI